MTGCVLCITEANSKNANQMTLSVHAPSSIASSSVRNAIEAVEDTLIKDVIASEPSRGRFLYDMALEYGEVKPDGILQQRNPLNSSERVWMNVIDIPSVISSLIDGKMNDNIHKAKSCLVVCKENFGNTLHRCQPYVLVTSKQAKNVAFATSAVNNAIKRHAQNNIDVPFSSDWTPANVPSHHKPLALDTTRHADKPTIKSRKITIPSWFMSDEALRRDLQRKSTS